MEMLIAVFFFFSQLRFLRARKFDVNLAMKMYVLILEARKEDEERAPKNTVSQSDTSGIVSLQYGQMRAWLTY